jgi:CheY-like chemotaxis protein
MAPRILVADDDAWILRMVTTVLEKRGYQVDTAVDGEDALKRALAQRPDLVITDVMMPKMDGWTLVKSLRARRDTAFVPVIFLTALGADDDRIRGFRLGADDYLPKPFRFEELDLRVTKTLRRTTALEQETRSHIAAVVPDESSPRRTVHDPVTPPHGVPIQPRPRTGLVGALNDIGLSALLTMLEMERKSGVLTVTSIDNRVARVFVRNGRVVHARIGGTPPLLNQSCIYHLLGWSAGGFEFSPAEVTMEDQVHSTTTHLLMEGARLLDETAASGR